jgi:hydrogenase-1 operon protein HyaF
MNELRGIPIAAAEAPLVTGNALPIVHEIEALLGELVASGRAASIDLRSLPMLPGDYEQLQQWLGEGEVSATVEAFGPTRVRETAVSGVWWITHYSVDDQVIAEFIEVTHVPEILKTHPMDARQALETLRSRLMQSAETTEGEANAG